MAVLLSLHGCRGVLFDIDGVLVTSWQAIPGAAESLRCCRQPDCADIPHQHHDAHPQPDRGPADGCGHGRRRRRGDHRCRADAGYVRDQYPGARCFLVNSGQIGEDMPGIDLVYASEVGDAVPETPDVVLLGAQDPSTTTSRSAASTTGWPRACPSSPCTAARRGTPPRGRGRHRHVLDRHGGDIGRKATAVGQAGARGVPGLGRSPRRRSRGDVHGRRRPQQRRAGRAGGRHDRVLVRTGKFRQDTLDRGPQTNTRCSPTTSSSRSPTCPICWGCNPRSAAACAIMSSRDATPTTAHLRPWRDSAILSASAHARWLCHHPDPHLGRDALTRDLGEPEPAVQLIRRSLTPSTLSVTRLPQAPSMSSRMRRLPMPRP